jgi:single-strand selective monofunctional uracil DNA glycosylase
MLRKKLKKSPETDDTTKDQPQSSKELAENPIKTNPLQTSKFFPKQFWQKLQNLEFEMSEKLEEIDFCKDKNIAITYNPLRYASEVHCNYMEKFLDEPKRFL